METAAIIEILHALIGITAAASLVVMVWGFLVYVTRLGTLRRDEGIAIMEWAVGLCIATIALIGALRFVTWWLA